MSFRSTTLREMCQIIGIDEDPVSCALVVAGVLRTIEQQEAATLEGEASSVLVLQDQYGSTVNGDMVRKWLDRLGKVADMTIPMDNPLMRSFLQSGGD